MSLHFISYYDSKSRWCLVWWFNDWRKSWWVIEFSRGINWSGGSVRRRKRKLELLGQESEEVAEETEQNEDNYESVSQREVDNAINVIERWSDVFSWSAIKISENLLSDGFPQEVIDIAIKEADVDWNETALNRAKSWSETFSWSNSKPWDNLVDDWFSEEEADYAIENLD